MPVTLEYKDTARLLAIIADQAMGVSSGKTEAEARDALLNRLRRSLTRIKTSSGKDKGKALQFWVCERISKITGIQYVQSDDSCLIHSREMGQPGADIVLRGEAIKAFPYSVECKSTESLGLLETIKQASANQKDGTDWLIVHRRKAYKEPIVILAWSAFEKLIMGKGR